MAVSGSIQFKVNERVYHARGVEREYRSRDLTRFEVMALLKYHDAFAGRDMLDIGVGTGRTSLYLAPIVHRYEAIDYSPVMVQHLARAMPEISVRQADMRDLSQFNDSEFDFILATNNVIDAVGHDDRLRALREAGRVLRTGGVLMLSTHNRDYREALRGPRLHWSRNPVTEVHHLHRWMRQMGNYARVGALRELNPSYALLNDEGHYYACLHYYIDQEGQRRQFAALGFEVLDVLDQLGHFVSANQRVDDSPCLMYVVRKTA